MRASTTDALDPGVAYSSLIAVFDRFDETYYVEREECDRVAREVLQRLESDPSWMTQVIKEARRRFTSLVESPLLQNADQSDPMTWSSGQVAEWLREHYELHLDAYRWARVPESLDRGSGIFTSTLFGRLAVGGFNGVDQAAEFRRRTTPDHSSLFAKLEVSVERLLDSREVADALDASITSGQFQMLLSPSVLAEVRSVAESWGILFYHGYGSREYRNLGDVALRLREIRRSLIESREAILPEQQVDEERLFGDYAEIGRMKIDRRILQLQNFRRLDRVMASAAHHLELAEVHVRRLLPEELQIALDTEFIDSETVKLRWPDLVAIFGEQGERLYWDDDARAIARVDAFSNNHVPQASRRDHQFQGLGVVGGHAIGRCVVVARRASDQASGFRPGDIVVTYSADPDLIPLMRVAGAVVTGEGGPTSHAAIVCRELGVPLVVDVDALFGYVQTGDLLDVDAYNGVVTVQQQMTSP